MREGEETSMKLTPLPLHSLTPSLLPSFIPSLLHLLMVLSAFGHNLLSDFFAMAVASVSSSS